MNAPNVLSAEQYLKMLSEELRPLPPADRTAILDEINSHISDRSAEGISVANTVSALGSPDVLARSYIDDHQLVQALGSPSPARLLTTILARAGGSAAALGAGFVAAALYAVSLSLVAIAILKPIIPRYVGLWTGPRGFSFGIYPPPAGAEEHLGYWIIPIAVLGALVCYLVATALMRRCARWLLRRTRGRTPL